MKCPACGAAETKVVDSRPVDGGDEVRRRRACTCGARWTTVATEKQIGGITFGRGLPSWRTTTGGTPQVALPRVVETQPVGPPNTTGCAPRDGGVGGGLPSRSDPDLIRISRSRSAEVVSKRRTGPAYTDEFGRWWDHTGRCHGNKGAAWKAWQAIGDRPALEVLCATWSRYMTSGGPANGRVQHVATWLNGRGWETEWRPATNAPPARAGAAPGLFPRRADPPREDPYCEAHSTFGKNLPSTKPSFKPKRSCPGCVEYNARHAGRRGEPTELGDMLPAWAQTNGGV